MGEDDVIHTLHDTSKAGDATRLTERVLLLLQQEVKDRTVECTAKSKAEMITRYNLINEMNDIFDPSDSDNTLGQREIDVNDQSGSILDLLLEWKQDHIAFCADGVVWQ